MSVVVKPPCDEDAIRAGIADPSCAARGRWVLAATILGSSMAFIDGTVVNVAIPAIQSNLNATGAQAQWVVESYALLLAALVLVGGGLGDLYGRRKIFCLGTLIFTAASVWCGLSADITQLIVARAVQGIGGALLVPGSLALISASFPDAERGRAIGTWSGFTAITTAFGPVMGGWLVEHGSWRYVFFVNVPLAIAVLTLTMWKVPESRNENAPRRLDWLGAILGTIGWGGVVYALIEFSTHSSAVVIAAAIGIVALIAFFFVEAYSSAPMMPLSLYRSRDFTGANLLTLFLYAALGGFIYYFPLNLIQVQHYSPTQAGAALLPFILLMFLLSRWSGGLVQHYGARRPLIVGPLVVSAGFLLFTRSGSGSYWGTIFPATLAVGFGMAVSVPPLTTTVMGAVSRDRAGAASGINNSVSRIAGLLAIAIFGVILYHVFDRTLTEKMKNFPAPVKQEIDEQRSRLAAAKVDNPQGRLAVEQSFFAGYRVILWIAATLSVASAISTALLIGKEVRPNPAPG